MPLTIRLATPADAEAICTIHNQGIADRTATLETTLRTPASCLEWLMNRDTGRHPVIVAEDGDTIAGWASVNRFNPREVYAHVADFSVYVARASRGQGVGALLLEDLIARARTIGYHKMVLAALARNVAGRALYRKCGFTHVGIYREQGQLDSEWVDVVIMERLL